MEPSTRTDPAAGRMTGPALLALRRRRAELRESMGELERALAAPAAPVALRAPAWTERVHQALADLSDDFIDHIVITEAPDGLHQSILSASVRLANAVTALADEHPVITETIAALLADTETMLGTLDTADSADSADTADTVDTAGASAGVEDIRARCGRLLGHLARHRQRGADLIYEAFETDIGGGD